jgi:hypothetical protein
MKCHPKVKLPDGRTVLAEVEFRSTRDSHELIQIDIEDVLDPSGNPVEVLDDAMKSALNDLIQEEPLWEQVANAMTERSRDWD